MQWRCGTKPAATLGLAGTRSGEAWLAGTRSGLMVHSYMPGSIRRRRASSDLTEDVCGVNAVGVLVLIGN